MAGRILADFFAKGLDFFGKCAIIKIRGNTGDGYFLRLVKITANSGKVWAVISFCSACRLPTLSLQVQRYPVEEVLPKLCTSGITSLRRTRRKKKRKFYVLRSRRKQPPPFWCFQGHGFLRGSFIIHHRRRFVKVICGAFSPAPSAWLLPFRGRRGVPYRG